MSSFVEIGQKFGRLTVIGFQPSKVVKGKSVLGSWIKCSCSCGGEVVTKLAPLRKLSKCSSCRTNDTRSNIVGKVFTSRNSGAYTVLDFINGRVHIKFNTTGFETTIQLVQIKTGSITDLLLPRINGIGFIGVGEHKSVDGISNSTPAYNAWINMLSRCYPLSNDEKITAYEGVSVCKEWHNFQNFAEWYYKNKPPVSDIIFDIDKDLKIIGNMEYSPSGCSFVPRQINSLFTGYNRHKQLKRGVVFIPNTGKYTSSITFTENGVKKRVHCGTFNTEQEAYLEYLRSKTEIVKSLAYKYMQWLDKDVYFNLINNVKDFISK